MLARCTRTSSHNRPSYYAHLVYTFTAEPCGRRWELKAPAVAGRLSAVPKATYRDGSFLSCPSKKAEVRSSSGNSPPPSNTHRLK